MAVEIGKCIDNNESGIVCEKEEEEVEHFVDHFTFQIIAIHKKLDWSSRGADIPIGTKISPVTKK